MNEKSSPESFEVALEKLQLTVKKLEAGELSLEESLSAFEEGVRLTKQCQEQLAVAEKRVEVLMSANAHSVETKPFDPKK
ncbi:MAG: exodeoxyribonuclease VII small subunit [Bdellovibrionales bacterium]|nr:exodeoxyribonuclease VII small subunit [Bdellovibrionales bacterium]